MNTFDDRRLSGGLCSLTTISVNGYTVGARQKTTTSALPLHRAPETCRLAEASSQLSRRFEQTNAEQDQTGTSNLGESRGKGQGSSGAWVANPFEVSPADISTRGKHPRV